MCVERIKRMQCYFNVYSEHVGSDCYTDADHDSFKGNGVFNEAMAELHSTTQSTRRVRKSEGYGQGTRDTEPRRPLCAASGRRGC